MKYSEYKAASLAAIEALRRFDEENSALLRRREDLRQAIKQACWPPPGHEECSGEKDRIQCHEIVALDEKGHPLAEGWVQGAFTCGDGPNGQYYCPCHVAQAAEDAGRCKYCSD